MRAVKVCHARGGVGALSSPPTGQSDKAPHTRECGALSYWSVGEEDWLAVARGSGPDVLAPTPPRTTRNQPRSIWMHVWGSQNRLFAECFAFVEKSAKTLQKNLIFNFIKKQKNPFVST